MIQKALYFLLAALMIAADQVSKWYVTEHINRPGLEGAAAPRPDFIAWLADAPERIPYTALKVLPFFNIVMVWNEGISFGLVRGMGDIAQPLLMALSAVIALVFGVWMSQTQSRFQGISLALVIGGALGNVIDRARFGAVIDFLDFHAAGWHYPAFNVADSCIVMGVAGLLIHAIFLEKKTGLEAAREE